MKTRIQVVRNVLQANDKAAEQNRLRLDEAGALALNLISAPGSGKTTLLEKSIPALGSDRCAVLVGDLQTSRDAERLASVTERVVQINTGGGCHLSANQVSMGLERLALDGLEFLFIENVGNMVCPVSFDLGEHLRVALLSVPEGDDKVAKYPTLFQTADCVVLNKKDLVDVLEFDVSRVREDLARVNSAVPFLQLSTKTGEGFDQWVRWLRSLRRVKERG